LIPAVKLGAHLHLKAKEGILQDGTQDFSMILRYSKIREFLPLLEIDEVLPCAKENSDIDTHIMGAEGS
jgi:hypothetical protein